MYQGSVIELSQSALRGNLSYIRQLVGEGVIISSVVKGNAYGHGIEQFVPMAERENIRHFSVANASEAQRVHASLTRDSHIMILGDIDEESLAWAIEKGLSFWVFNPARLELAQALAHKIGRPALVHLEIETGLNRTGLESYHLPRVVELVETHPEDISVVGVCSHFAGAESVANYLRMEHQFTEFQRISQELSPIFSHRTLRHMACSAATLNWPKSRMDLVRVGIAQFGFWPSEETRIQFLLKNGQQNMDLIHFKDPLKRILKWKTRVMDIKEVSPGEFISYGNSYLAKRHHRIATIPVGYYHGFPRRLSNYGYVLIRGKKAPVIGVVNMSVTILDVTDIPGVATGEEVVIIGKQKNAEISVSSFSEQTSLLNYEVLVRLPGDITRLKVR
ncbi:alanine racemase [Myxococcota bacterium]|nr:alanine racemase [Myxococcota bacterium]MBU1537584.1 alanine racemase [Myxococcota bacterium]